MFRTALFAALFLAGSVSAGTKTHTMTIRNGSHVEQRTFVWCHGSWHTCREACCDVFGQWATVCHVPPRSYQRQAPWLAPKQMPDADETFPYDGGPKNPVPMPSQQTPEDAKLTQISYVSLQPGETLVSVPNQSEEKKSSSGKWNFPAYGEKPTRNKK
jgi:hypothetical protein